MFVYLITNKISGMRYVGQTRQSLIDRWSAHCHKNRCRYLYNAIKKYGKESFVIESIIEVQTRELANEFEIEYIERYKTLAPNGYNICLGGDDRSLCFAGRKHSEETKKKMSLAKLGKPSPRLGAIVSDESKQKMRAAKLGRKHPEEVRQRMVEAQKIRRLRESNE